MPLNLDSPEPAFRSSGIRDTSHAHAVCLTKVPHMKQPKWQTEF